MANLKISLTQVETYFPDLMLEIKRDLDKKEKRDVNVSEVSFVVEYAFIIRITPFAEIFVPRAEPQFDPSAYEFSSLSGKLGRKKSSAQLTDNHRAFVLDIFQANWLAERKHLNDDRERYDNLNPAEQNAEREDALAQLRGPGFMEIKIPAVREPKTSPTTVEGEGYKIFWADATHLYSGEIKMDKVPGTVSPHSGDDGHWGYVTHRDGLGVYFEEKNWLKKHLESKQPGVKARGKTLVYAKVEITGPLPKENEGKYEFKQSCTEFKILEIYPWTKEMEADAKDFIIKIENEQEEEQENFFDRIARDHDRKMEEFMNRGAQAMSQMENMTASEQKAALDRGDISPFEMVLGLIGRAKDGNRTGVLKFNAIELSVTKLERVKSHTMLVVTVKEKLAQSLWIISPEERCAFPMDKNSPDLEFLTRDEVSFDSLSPESQEMLESTIALLQEHAIKEEDEEEGEVSSIHSFLSSAFKVAAASEGENEETSSSMPMTTTNEELGVRYLTNAYGKVFKIEFMKKDASGRSLDLNNRRIRLTQGIPGLNAEPGDVLTIRVMGELLMMTRGNENCGFVSPYALIEGNNFDFV